MWEHRLLHEHRIDRLVSIKAIGQELFTEGIWRAALLYDLKAFHACCVLDHEPWLDTKVKFFLQALFFTPLRRSEGCTDAHLGESSKCSSWPCSPPPESRTSLRRIIKPGFVFSEAVHNDGRLGHAFKHPSSTLAHYRQVLEFLLTRQHATDWKRRDFLDLDEVSHL